MAKIVLSGRQDILYWKNGANYDKVPHITEYNYNPIDPVQVDATNLQTPSGTTETLYSSRPSGKPTIVIKMQRDFADATQNALLAVAGAGTTQELWHVLRAADGTVARKYKAMAVLKAVPEAYQDNQVPDVTLTFEMDVKIDTTTALPATIPTTLGAGS